MFPGPARKNLSLDFDFWMTYALFNPKSKIENPKFRANEFYQVV
jgi:hypothetical protein